MTIIIGLILVGAFVAFVCKLLIADSKPSRRSRDSGLDRVKTNAKIDTAAVLTGAALAHQMMKHHKHDDAKDTDDHGFDALDDELDDLYDHDFYDDLDTQDYEDTDYDYERAAYEEEQAAYDDFIASMDMADD